MKTAIHRFSPFVVKVACFVCNLYRKHTGAQTAKNYYIKICADRNLMRYIWSSDEMQKSTNKTSKMKPDLRRPHEQHNIHVSIYICMKCRLKLNSIRPNWNACAWLCRWAETEKCIQKRNSQNAIADENHACL